jgi:hypothetical protein
MNLGDTINCQQLVSVTPVKVKKFFDACHAVAKPAAAVSMLQQDFPVAVLCRL